MVTPLYAPTGTGMTCIYPLLGARMNKWRFVATDISEEAVDSATRNVSLSSLQDHIEGIISTTHSMLTGFPEVR